MKLGELPPAHVQKLHATMQAQGRARNTVQRAHRVLHNALNRALAWGYIQRNVCTVVHPPTPERNKLRTLTPEQVKALLSAARGGRWDALLSLAIATGMRKGELLGLKWEDVDLETGVLRVQRQLGRDGIFSEPKTRLARRGIHLPRSTVAVLREHGLRQVEEKRSVGADWVAAGLVFCTHQGKPLQARNVVREFKNLLGRTGLPEIRFHDLRHTAATLMLLQGVPAKVVQGRLGHSQISLTMDTYSHLLPSMDREAAESLDLLLR
ncbi:MAG: site-specific integrase [Chloroflexota bacterium]|nr:site-specific integrase [Chloroflexota bacterium]